MFKQILVPVDLADTELAKPSIETAVSLVRVSGGNLRLLNVLPMTPVMLAEYVPPDFDVQQRLLRTTEALHPTTCWAAIRLHAATSAGRPSSTSATGR